MDNQVEINLLKNRITNLELQNIKIMAELKGLRQDIIQNNSRYINEMRIVKTEK